MYVVLIYSLKLLYCFIDLFTEAATLGQELKVMLYNN